MRARLGFATVLMALTAAGGSGQPAATRQRAVVVVSDLHMGVGRDAAGAWHPYEDFRWASELASFLDAADREGASAIDLVLNGDAFDLIQSSGGDCAAGPDVGCTEGEAVARLDRVLTAHRAEIATLEAFARKGSNRVVFVPGDSDAALLFPAVRRRLLSAMAAPPGRVDVAAAGFWRSSDGRVHAEHGHQIGFSPHRFADWPSPFITRNGGTYLARPLGERIAGDYFRRLELTYPVVDNVAVRGAGLKPALAAAGDVETAEPDPALLTYLLLTTIAWQQFRMELDDGDVEPPVWDVAQVRSQGGAFLASAVPDDDPIRPMAAKALASRVLDAAALTDDEIVALCDYRAAVRRSRRRFEPTPSQFAPRGPAIPECPRTPETRGGVFDYFWRSRDLTFSRYLEALNTSSRKGAPPTVFVHGHTHLPDRSQTGANMISGGLLRIPGEGFSPVRGALTPIVINGGAWQRTITPVQLASRQAEKDLRAIQPEDLAPCYSFVQIAAYDSTPAPSVRYWRPDGSGAWAIGSSCGP